MRNRVVAIIFALALMLAISAQADSAWECNQCGRRVQASLGDICPYCGARRHVHTWREATYTEPKTCIECGATEGAPLPPTPTPTPESAKAYHSGDYPEAYDYLGLEANADADAYEELAQYYRLAADKGDPYALTGLGALYEYGDGVEQSYEIAFQYYLRAVDQGGTYALVRIGKMYEYGHGVQQSYEEAAEWYQSAIAAGAPDAQDSLERLRENGYIQ